MLQVPVNFTWICGSQRFYHPKFLQGFAEHGLKLLTDPLTAAKFNDMYIGTILHGFASHTVEADDAVCWAFIRALTDRAVTMLEEFRPQVCTQQAATISCLSHVHLREDFQSRVNSVRCALNRLLQSAVHCVSHVHQHENTKFCQVCTEQAASISNPLFKPCASA